MPAFYASFYKLRRNIVKVALDPQGQAEPLWQFCDEIYHQ